MNGPIKMYRMKQIVQHDVPVKLPTCMYRMKNIYSGSNGTVDGSRDYVSPPNKKLDLIDQVKQFLKNNQHIPGMAELEAKQEQILKQLSELKEQILSIKSNLKLNVISTEQPTGNPVKTSCLKKVPLDLPDVVINVNPNNPPYSLVIFQKLLQDVVCLKVTTHLHSTVSSLPDNTKTVENALLNFKPKSTVPEIFLRLIWKNVNSGTEFLVSFVPILGEVNLLRYLASVLPTNYNYNQDADSVEIDSVLDLCHQIVGAKTKTARASLLQGLNKSLGKSQWLLGRNSPSLADIAAYSAIQQVSSSNDISANLGKWYQRCTTVF